MRVFFGMILGAFLTVGAAFVYDSWGTGSTTTGTTSNMVTHRNMVNWDVVGENWRLLRQRARETWTMLSQKVSS